MDKGASSDCPPFWGYSGAHFFSEKAVLATEQLLKGKVEILPLIHPEKVFCDSTNVIDAIEYDRAVVRQLKTGLKVGFDKYAFHQEKVEGEPVFRVY